MHGVYYTHHAVSDAWHRSENVALDAFSCATVPVLSEGGPAKWLKNKNLPNHPCDYEPGRREFESLRARIIHSLREPSITIFRLSSLLW
jgi:hypothetical protein